MLLTIMSLSTIIGWITLSKMVYPILAELSYFDQAGLSYKNLYIILQWFHLERREKESK